MALPTIMAGIRISLVSVIATATIAPLANVDTLGRPIISPNVYGTAGQLAACIVVALVTFGADALFAAVPAGRDARGPQTCRTGPARWPPPRLPVIEEEHADIVRRTHPLLALLAILCLGFVFAACGDDEEPSSSSSSSSEQRRGARQGDPEGLRRRVQAGHHRRLEELHRAVRARRDLLAGARGGRLQGQAAAQPRLRADRPQGAAGRQGRRLPGVHRHRADLVLRGQDGRRPEGRQQGLRGRRRPASPRRTSPRSPRRRSRTPTGSA